MSLIMNVVGHGLVRSYDVDAYGGRGEISFTYDKSLALCFPSLQAAVEAWWTQSTVAPLRPDGEPNRPLTAYSVTFDMVD